MVFDIWEKYAIVAFKLTRGLDIRSEFLSENGKA